MTKGGAELPVTNSAVALGVALAGPGCYSLDRRLRLRVPRGLLAVCGSQTALASRQTPDS